MNFCPGGDDQDDSMDSEEGLLSPNRNQMTYSCNFISNSYLTNMIPDNTSKTPIKKLERNFFCYLSNCWFN